MACWAGPGALPAAMAAAVFQPEWGPDGQLYFTWDQSGWGQLYRWNGSKAVRVHGSAGAELWRPQWVFGTRCYALHPDGRFAAVSSVRGMPVLEIGKLAGGRALLPAGCRTKPHASMTRWLSATASLPW